MRLSVRKYTYLIKKIRDQNAVSNLSKTMVFLECICIPEIFNLKPNLNQVKLHYFVF